MLTEVDGQTLTNLRQAWSTLVKAQAKLIESGLLLKTPTGCIQQNPLLGDREQVQGHGSEAVGRVWAHAFVT